MLINEGRKDLIEGYIYNLNKSNKQGQINETDVLITFYKGLDI